MNKFNAGDLSKKPKQVFDAARSGGAIIQHKDRQGNVVEEFVLIRFDSRGYIIGGGRDIHISQVS